MYRKLLMTVVCMAALAGAADAAKQGQPCGMIGVPFLRTQCDAGLWCEMPSGQCAANLIGTCVNAPGICNQIFRPVCGCNGMTYSNDCERQAAKVSKAHDRKCS